LKQIGLTGYRADKVIRRAFWNPVTDKTTITDSLGTRVFHGNLIQDPQLAYGVSPTWITSDQPNFPHGEDSPSGNTADKNDSKVDTVKSKKKDNVSGTLEHSS
jgi:hypothetical protein